MPTSDEIEKIQEQERAQPKSAADALEDRIDTMLERAEDKGTPPEDWTIKTLQLRAQAVIARQLERIADSLEEANSRAEQEEVRRVFL